MSKYSVLVGVLDQLRREAPPEYTAYHPLETDKEKVDQARARALIHLFLKVRFGLLEFAERETFYLDGTQDGGIDAYFIDRETRVIYFLQSKFRTTEANFETKNIDVAELLKMDVDRVTKGLETDGLGVRYNNRVQRLIEETRQIDDIGRYKYVIVILANLKPQPPDRVRRLIGDFPLEVMDHKRCYLDLVFPLINGTYYNVSELTIEIDLSSRDLSSSRIKYPVATEHGDCVITIIFVPTVEIAKVLHKYKNSILQFNPRSYLSLSHNPVNREIARTISDTHTNEFALFNNGITMLSDDTTVSERTGTPTRGLLCIKNPQIINGGQTAFTLSYTYEQSIRDGDAAAVFKDKEVMLKVVTFSNPNIDPAKRLQLIEAVSKATNQQTAVIEADRRSNDRAQVELQRRIYEDFGYFYERKKGEFFDGLANGYIDRNLVIDRDVILRLALAIHGDPSTARRASARVLYSKDAFNRVMTGGLDSTDLIFCYRCYRHLDDIQAQFSKQPNNRFGTVNYGNAVRYGKFAVVSVAYRLLEDEITAKTVDETSKTITDKVLAQWLQFEDAVQKKPTNRDYFRPVTDVETGTVSVQVDFDNYYKGRNVKRDIEEFPFQK